MTEETLLSVEGSNERATIASYFRQFAEQLDADGSVTFSTDKDEVSLTVPETAEFELEVESETEEGETEYEIEFEIEWSTEDQAEAEEAVLTIGGESEGHQETIEEAEPAASDERAAAEQGDEGEEGGQ
ncbi:MAG: amphi-Trp domain-containing protein [Halohasta sp.]